jgi:hypothetical protein
MKKLLEKISWLTRKWNYTFQLFTLKINDDHNSWGFRFLTFDINLREHSLLAFECRLPNKTNVRVFTIDDWDFFFISYRIWLIYDELDDSRMWNPEGLSKWDGIKLRILSKIFR